METAEKISLKVAIDECVSTNLSEALRHCGKKRDPILNLTHITSHRIGASDLEWIARFTKSGHICLSFDTSMISDHDIAEFIKRIEGRLILLPSEISQLERWKLGRWMFRFLPRLVEHSAKLGKGSTMLAHLSGNYRLVKPTSEVTDYADDKNHPDLP